jgi:hypothetical protein
MATIVFFKKKLAKVYDRAIGEKSSNLGRILWSQFSGFLAIFGEKLAFSSKTNVMIKFLHNLHSFVMSQKGHFLAKIFLKS